MFLSYTFIDGECSLQKTNDPAVANHSCEVDDAMEVTKCRGVTEEQKKWATNLFGKAPTCQKMLREMEKLDHEKEMPIGCTLPESSKLQNFINTLKKVENEKSVASGRLPTPSSLEEFCMQHTTDSSLRPRPSVCSGPFFRRRR